MCIGNLSSDRVSKKEVFAVFSKYGRLAQISMKSAYGFVQYHNVSEAQAALEACQDMELGGRRIRECALVSTKNNLLTNLLHRPRNIPSSKEKGWR